MAPTGTFHRLIGRDSDTLLVAFSSWNTSPGRFRPFRALVPLPYALLFVNCPDNAWYLGGIPGLGATVDAVSGALAQLAGSGGYRRVVTYGSSMGGFGALLHGLVLGAHVIVTHGAESILGLRGSRSARGIGDPALIREGRRRVRGWRRSVPRHAGEIRYLVGETDLQDTLHARYFEKLTGRRAFAVRGAAHDVERFAAVHGGLARHLQALIDGAGGEVSGDWVLMTLPDARHVAAGYRCRYLGAATPANPWVGSHMLRVIDALVGGDAAAARDAAAAAARLRPDMAWFRYALIITLMGTMVSPPPPVCVRRSCCPRPLTGSAAARITPVDAVDDYDVHLLATLETTGAWEAGLAAAVEACRLCGDDAALLALTNRIRARREELTP